MYILYLSTNIGLKLGPGSEKHGFEHSKSTSRLVVIATIMLFVNPPAHAVAIFTNPCCPSFISSFYFTCRTVTENDSSFLHKIPFVLLEGLTFISLFIVVSFNCFMIFLGLAWIREELRLLRYVAIDISVENHIKFKI